MKPFIYIILSVALFISGCGLTSQERMEKVKGYIAQAEIVSDAVDEQLAIADETIKTLEATLADMPADNPATIDFKTGIADAKEAKAKLVINKETVDRTIAALNAALEKINTEGADWTDEVGMVATGAQAVGASIGGVAGGWIIAGTTLIAGLLTLWRNITTIATAKKNFKTVVKSVDAALEKLSPNDAVIVKDTMKPIQGPDVTAAVKAVKAK